MPLLTVRGNNYEVGCAIGKKQRGATRQLFNHVHINAAMRRAGERILANHKEKLPHLVSELSGVADGTGINLLDLFTYNAFEDSLNPRRRNERCTTLFWNDDVNTFIGHNEEAFSMTYGRLILLRAYIRGSAPHLSFNYPGLLCGDSIGMNSNGMIQALDALYPKKTNASGFIRSFIGRSLLEAKNLRDAERILKELPSTGGMHFLLYSRHERRGVSVETHINRIATLALPKSYVHANHYQLKPFLRLPHAATKRSHFRVTRVAELFKELRKPSGQHVHEILTDHRNHPYGLCKHPAGPAASATLAQVIVDVHKGTFSVANGIPCSHAFKQYSLSF